MIPADTINIGMVLIETFREAKIAPRYVSSNPRQSPWSPCLGESTHWRKNDR